MSEADRLERVWQKGQGSRSPCGEEALQEGSDTEQHAVLGRPWQRWELFPTPGEGQ